MTDTPNERKPREATASAEAAPEQAPRRTVDAAEVKQAFSAGRRVPAPPYRPSIVEQPPEVELPSPEPKWIAPPYDQWLVSVEGTGTARVVEVVREKLADVRTRPDRATGSYLAGMPRITRTYLFNGDGDFVDVDEVSTPDVKRRRRKPEDQLTFEAVTDAIVCNLVHHHLSCPGNWEPGFYTDLGWGRIPLSHQRLGGNKANSRYRSRALSRMLVPVVKAMDELGLVYLVEGNASRKLREQSRIRATPQLRDFMNRCGVSFDDIMRDTAHEELIILKGRKPAVWWRDPYAEPIDYQDTADTIRMREEMRALNGWWIGADIGWAGADGHVSVHSRSMRRVFNNNSFEQGGRLFGGFWQRTTMKFPKRRHSSMFSSPEPWRGDIRIEREPVAVVDYSAMFLRLLYCEAEVQAPAGDLYAGIKGLGPEYRAGVKQVISSLMFRDGPPQQVPRGTRKENGLPKGMKIKTMLSAISERHSAVARLFCGTRIGHKLFKRESGILLRVLHRCRSQGIIALPIHDAVIVKESTADDVRRIMLECYEAETGFKGEVGEPKNFRVEATDDAIASGGIVLDTVFNPDAINGEQDESGGDDHEDWI